MLHALDTAIDELRAVCARMDEHELAAACSEIVAARKIMLYGCGREGLMMRAFAMRLHHMGLSVSMQGDVTAPPLGQDDMFLVSAGPGELATVSALVDKAQAAGAQVLMVTAEPEADTPRRADRLLVIPAQTMARDQNGQGKSSLPMGSLFEGAMFLVFEVMVQRLAALLNQNAASMRARHTNME